MSDARALAMFFTFVFTMVMWATGLITIFYAASNAKEYLNHTNPYYGIGIGVIILAAISSLITIAVWSDGLKESR